MKVISVFGVFVADLCFFANAIPEKGQTILGNNHIVGPGGKGSNQAIAAARLGGSVNFITKIVPAACRKRIAFGNNKRAVAGLRSSRYCLQFWAKP